jgi:hypothetical protein
MIYGQDLTTPYATIDYGGIVYSTCKDFDYISRYRNLRQVVHCPNDVEERTVTLETVNPFITNTEVKYHEVTTSEINRLDLIAENELGSATYGWVIAYFNKIEDGFTAREGQKLIIPNNVTALLNQGEILAPITALRLNLGEE